VACTVLLAVPGCKRPKREPVPGPQVGRPGAPPSRFGGGSLLHWPGLLDTQKSPEGEPSASGRRAERQRQRAGGIAWFQGSVDEAFAGAGSEEGDGKAPPC